MARKPPDWRQPSLFPPDPATDPSSVKAGDAGQAPPNTPQPEYNSLSKPEGDQHAVQDDHSSTPGAEPADTGPAQERPADASDDGALRPRTENPPRSLEGNAHPDDAGQRREPDSERGAGTGPQGSGGSFADRVSSGRQGSPVPGRSYGVHPPSFAARIKASRRQRQPTLFDSLPLNPASGEPELPAPPELPEPKETPQPPATTTPPPTEAANPSDPPASSLEHT